jgi:hypothetical protein
LFLQEIIYNRFCKRDRRKHTYKEQHEKKSIQSKSKVSSADKKKVKKKTLNQEKIGSKHTTIKDSANLMRAWASLICLLAGDLQKRE